MIIKILKFSTGSMVAGCLISDTFARKVDRNLLSPFRDFKLVLTSRGEWVMPEDFSKFGKDLTKGIKNMFIYGE